MWPFKKKSADHALRELTEGLSGALGGKLQSVILYGSKASGEYREEHSDLNVFIVVEDVSWDTLSLMARPIQAWVKEGHAMPVFIQGSELPVYAGSLPIEFLDMQDHHRVIHGPDPLVGLQVGRAHLQAQCAQELCVKQLKLRQAILLAQGDAKKLRRLMIDSLPSILTLFRAVLRLKADVPKGSKLEAAKTLAQRVGFDADALARLGDLHMRRQTDNLDDLARHYLDIIERVLVYVQKP